MNEQLRTIVNFKRDQMILQGIRRYLYIYINFVYFGVFFENPFAFCHRGAQYDLTCKTVHFVIMKIKEMIYIDYM